MRVCMICKISRGRYTLSNSRESCTRGSVAEAIAARTRGDDYQARDFWLHACRLFQEHSAVEEIGFDDPELRYFDDVSLYYKWGVPDERGGTSLADHYQVKFHVDCAGCVTCDSLMDPEFIGAKSRSLLERVQDFSKAYGSAKIPFRLYFVSPWDTDSADPLAKLVSNQEVGQCLLMTFWAKRFPVPDSSPILIPPSKPDNFLFADNTSGM
jgi:hypothetical protein